jgi:hypothetical protein
MKCSAEVFALALKLPAQLCLGVFLALAAATQAHGQWYVDASTAARHLGGPSRYGPYSTRAEADRFAAANSNMNFRVIPGGKDVAGSTSSGSTAPPLDPVLQAAAQQLGTALGEWIRNSGARAAAAARQRQDFLAELETRRKEVERERLAVEQRRRQQIFDRLRNELKGTTSGGSDLMLKGRGERGELRLKAHDPAGQNSSTGELALKGTSTEPPATEKVCKSTGIAGLPGLYLSDCGDGSARTTSIVGTGDPTQLALAAQSLSGPEQALVEAKVLELARTNAALVLSTGNPRVESFRAAELAYQETLELETEASSTLEQARLQTEASTEASKLAEDALATQLAAGEAPPLEVVEALNAMAIVAKTSEEASVRAEEAFNAAGANVVIARSEAVRRLSAVAPQTGTAVVDLRDKQPSLVIKPGQLRPATGYDGPVNVPASAPSRVAVAACGLIVTVGDSVYNRGLVLGLTAVGGLNVPAGSRNAPEICGEASRQFRDTQAKADPALKEENRVSPTGYDFIIGMAQSVLLDRELVRAVLADIGLVKSSVLSSANYPSLRGRSFRILECHSNGAMICLHALTVGDITAGDVRLIGPQITEESLAMWSEMVRQSLVNRVDVFWMTRDPVPFAALGFVKLVEFAALPTLKMLDAALVPVAATIWPDEQLLATTIAKYGNLGFHALPCPLPADPTEGSVGRLKLGCHNARFYQDELARWR